MGRVILTVALAAALAAALVACGGSSTDAASTAPAATTAAPAETATPTAESTPGGPSSGEVAALFADNCATCHGADGSGGSAPPIDGEDNVDKVRSQIETGGDGMPAFSSKLPPGQIEALARYVAGGLQ